MIPGTASSRRALTPSSPAISRRSNRCSESKPPLIHARSERTHRSTLLHYVAANGIEDFRQKTPPNAVTIARCLLEAGAEVDALSNSYGGGRHQTTMNLLVSSTHPAEAGLQPALVETLVDFGAAINGLDDDSSPLMTALAFGYRDAAETLERRGARVDSVLAASGLGQLDLIRQFVVDKHSLRAGVPLVKPAWMSIPPDPKSAHRPRVHLGVQVRAHGGRGVLSRSRAWTSPSATT